MEPRFRKFCLVSFGEMLERIRLTLIGISSFQCSFEWYTHHNFKWVRAWESTYLPLNGWVSPPMLYLIFNYDGSDNWMTYSNKYNFSLQKWLHSMQIHSWNLCALFLSWHGSVKIIGFRYPFRAVHEARVASEKQYEEKPSQDWKIKMLYDGDCPLCMREVCIWLIPMFFYLGL